jgi:hypothetical protein
MDDIPINNKEKAWGAHINLTNKSTFPCPDWADLHAKSEWDKSGIIIWDKAGSRIIRLWHHQALDLLDDLRESSSWRNDGFLISWNSYSLPLSEKDRKARRSAENYRNQSKAGKLNRSEMHLSPIQSQEFLSFLESHQEEIFRMANERSEEAKKMLGRVYTLILSWRKERMQRMSNVSGGNENANGQ